MDLMPKRLAVAVSEADHSAGEDGAPVTLVEYGDYECPGCLNAEPVVSGLRRQFGAKLRAVFRHFPQNSVHPRASAAAEAAEAASLQGKFWEMHRALFANQAKVADVDLTHLPLSNGLDVYRFDRDINQGGLAKKVRADYDGGVLSGVSATPTFFINDQLFEGTADELGHAVASAI